MAFHFNSTTQNRTERNGTVQDSVEQNRTAQQSSDPDQRYGWGGWETGAQKNVE